MGYRIFTSEAKENIVNEYLREKETTGTSLRKFAEEHDLSFSTLKYWVKTYRAFLSERKEESVSESGSFLLIGQKALTTFAPVQKDPSVLLNSNISLRYKDAVLQFPKEQLKEVMEILRLW